jgi:hypothetical protein
MEVSGQLQSVALVLGEKTQYTLNESLSGFLGRSRRLKKEDKNNEEFHVPFGIRG